MKVMWRKSAVESLAELDEWRKGIELETIAEFIMHTIDLYFNHMIFQFIYLVVRLLFKECRSN